MWLESVGSTATHGSISVSSELKLVGPASPGPPHPGTNGLGPVASVLGPIVYALPWAKPASTNKSAAAKKNAPANDRRREARSPMISPPSELVSIATGRTQEGAI